MHKLAAFYTILTKIISILVKLFLFLLLYWWHFINLREVLSFSRMKLLAQKTIWGRYSLSQGWNYLHRSQSERRTLFLKDETTCTEVNLRETLSQGWNYFHRSQSERGTLFLKDETTCTEVNLRERLSFSRMKLIAQKSMSGSVGVEVELSTYLMRWFNYLYI